MIVSWNHWGKSFKEARAEAIDNLEKIRRVSLWFWRRKVVRDFYKWWAKYKLRQKQAGKPIDMELLKAGTESLRYAADSSWWSWDQGSAPFFWHNGKKNFKIIWQKDTSQCSPSNPSHLRGKPVFQRIDSCKQR
jgi:hypothetical protein